MEFEFVEDLPEELTCSICMKVLCRPHMVNCCEKQFCEECLEEWLRKNYICPNCRSTDFYHMLMRQKSRKLGELKVYCPNKKYGCESTLKISECNNHLSTSNAEGCLYIQLNCPNMCTSEVFSGNLKKHIEEECPRRQVPCTHCTLQGEHQFIVGDHLNTCPRYPLKCLQHCGATVLRKDLELHRDTCPQEFVPCLYRELGCKVEVCRKDLEKHMESNVLHHMTELAKSHLSLKAEHVKLQEEHAALKNDYAAVKSDCVAQKQLNNSVSKVMKWMPTLFSDNLQVAQIQTLLTDTTNLSMDKPLLLTLSESNLKAGYYYINLHRTKFRLEWEWMDKIELEEEKLLHSTSAHYMLKPRYQFCLFLCDPHKFISCDIEMNVSRHGEHKVYSKLASVCCIKTISHDKSIQLLCTVGYACKLANNLQIGIKFRPHDKPCRCDCHHATSARKGRGK